MQRSLILLLCLGLVRAATLQNYTVDDTSPDILYGGDIFQCNADACPAEVTEGAFNNSATLQPFAELRARTFLAVTTGSIMFSFNGTAIYASLDLVGTCAIILDGYEIQSLNITAAQAVAGERGDIAQSGLANGLHTLVIDPRTNPTLIGFDHLVYTVPGKKSHVAAIVGGVVGAVVLTIAALFLALFARRRKLIIRRNQRKSAVLRAINSARHDRKGGEEDATQLPT
ncbi:hypothetical protein B0H16DRAFT_1605860 [Mycena metata]|uniref:Uncharacterized protein n=1 Tax=Mycena metata TaxID=1033252 RepID=A0AAD7MJK9_9AGAR|nr:hypothetical protein B0H16DRAFT_1605860 [Mycena metata]